MRGTVAFGAAVGVLFAAALSRAETCAEFARSLGIPRDAATGSVVYRAAVTAPGASAADLVARAREAARGLPGPARGIAPLDDRGAGRLVARGAFRVAEDSLGLSWDSVRYVLALECGDGSCSLALSDLVVSPVSGDVDVQAEGDQTFESVVGGRSCFGRKSLLTQVHEKAGELLQSVASGIRAGVAAAPREAPGVPPGRVAAVDGASVYVSVGSADGLAAGDTLAVFADERSPEPLGAVTVTKVLGGHLARGTFAGGAIREGAWVRVPAPARGATPTAR